MLKEQNLIVGVAAANLKKIERLVLERANSWVKSIVNGTNIDGVWIDTLSSTPPLTVMPQIAFCLFPLKY